MTQTKKDSREIHEDFSKTVGDQAARKQQSRREKDRSIWFGLGAMGMVGWTIAAPTMLGLLLGLWLDTIWPGSFSWMLTLFVLGLAIGCFSAWQWVEREMNKMKKIQRKEKEEQDE
jgi:ATP synthase protein I